MSEVCSAASAASTTDSTELGFDTSSSVSRILSAETCSPHGGPESPSTTTYEALDTYNQTLDRVSMTLRDTHGTFGDALPAVLISKHHPEEEPDGSLTPWLPIRMRVHDAAQPHPPLLSGGQGPRGHSLPNLLISSAEGSPAKTSPSPASAEASPATGPGSSMSSHESLSLFDLDGFSSRTYPGCSPRMAVGTSESLLERWPTSGTAWHGGFSTHVSSECRSAAGVCSSSEPSLSEILQPPQTVLGRYSLSGRAARGILRRAQKRGRTLPAHLQAALQAVAGESELTRQL